MLNILNFRRNTKVRTAPLTRVAVVGDRDRRAILKYVLGDRVAVVGELETDTRIHHLNAVQPDVIFLDTTSRGVNPVVALSRLAHLAGSPRIVLLTDGPAATAAARRALAGDGQAIAVDIRNAAAVLPPDAYREAPNPRQQRPEHSPVAA